MLRALRGLCGMLVTVLAGVMLPLTGTQPAKANGDSGCDKYVDTGAGVVYKKCGAGEGSSGGSGSGGSGGQPSCELASVQDTGNAHWCEGDAACWANIPSSLYPDPEDWPPGQPSKESIYVFKQCILTEGAGYHDWYWYTPDEPSIEELAWEAYGQLEVPSFTLRFNPSDKAIVFLGTWWWAAGPGNGDLRGSSAAGLVAIAEPDRLEVDPGDGSGVMNCPWSTTKSDACAYTYERASTDGTARTDDGKPAYQARARLVYDVHFEMNGEVLTDLPTSIPTTIESDWETEPVQVTEAQAVVR